MSESCFCQTCILTDSKEHNYSSGKFGQPKLMKCVFVHCFLRLLEKQNAS